MAVSRSSPFMRLPSELRTLIWWELCQAPRVIKIVVHTYASRNPSPDFCEYESYTPPPVVLQICREARYMGLLHYTRVFQRSPLCPWSAPPDRPIYMNCGIDTVYLVPWRNTPPATHFPVESLFLSLDQENWENPVAASQMRRIAIPMLRFAPLIDHVMILGRLLTLAEGILVPGEFIINFRGRPDLVLFPLSPARQVRFDAAVALVKNQLAQIFQPNQISPPPLVSIKDYVHF